MIQFGAPPMKTVAQTLFLCDLRQFAPNGDFQLLIIAARRAAPTLETAFSEESRSGTLASRYGCNQGQIGRFAVPNFFWLWRSDLGYDELRSTLLLFSAEKCTTLSRVLAASVSVFPGRAEKDSSCGSLPLERRLPAQATPITEALK